MGEAKIRKKLGLPPRGLKASTDPLPYRVAEHAEPIPLADSPLFEAFLWTWVHGVRLDRLGTGHCLHTTRIAVELLRGIGYTAEPERVWVAVHRPDGRSRGTTPESMRLHLADDREGFAGHVLLRVDGETMLDVACQQYVDPRVRMPFLVFTADPAPFRLEIVSQGHSFFYWTPTAAEIAEETWDWRHAWETADLPAMGLTPDMLASLVGDIRRIERVNEQIDREA